MNRKVLVGLIILSFLLLELVPAITADSQTPPPASAYVASISVSSNPFVLNTTLPAINQLGSNIRFFQYPNLTGQLYAYEQQLPQTIATVNSVESTAWKVLPYWQNGELVINSTGAGAGSQSVSVTVTNSQPIATPAPFDQFLNITESQIASVLGSTTASQLWQQAMSDYFLNLLFQQNGQTLYAWVQNYTSSWVAVWVKLPNGIPASSSVTINIIFTNSIQYPYTGIYSAVYSGYDNGANVFIQYGYFGNQIPNGWTTGVYQGSFSPTPTANGLEMINNNGGEGTYVYASLPNTNDYAVIVSWWYSGTADAFVQELYGSVSNVIYTTSIGNTLGGDTPYASGGTGAQNEFYNPIAYIKNASTAKSTGFDGQGTYYVTTYFAIQGNTQYYGYSNHRSPFQITLPSSFSSFSLITSRTSPTVFIGAGDAGSTSYIYLDVVIVIPTPPNNVMPSITSISKSLVSAGGQYIAWRYSPVSNVINVTIHVMSFPSAKSNASIAVYSPNVGYQSTDSNTSFYALFVDFYGGSIYFHSSTSNNWVQLYSSLPQPSTAYPFTFSVILTENSAGNVTVSTVYINSTAYSVNVNTPFPWSQIGYVGIRSDANNLFYVSYFAVSPTPYGGTEQFVNDAESSSWKVLPYWYEGVLIVNSTGASAGGQYIAWRYSPISNVINVTVRVASYPSKSTYAGIAFYGTSLQNSPYFMVAFYTGAVYYFTGSSSTSLATFTTPNPPFIMSVILVENSAGNVTVQSVIINGSTTYSLNTNVPFPWSQIAYIGIRADPGNLFNVSYFAVTQLLDAYSLVTNPFTNTPYTGTVYVAVFPYPISYDVYVSPAPVVSSQSPLPVLSPSFTSTTTPYPVVSTSTSSGTVNVIPSIGAWTSANASLFLTTLTVGNQIYTNIPMAESTSWKVYPYWQNELVVNSTGAGTSGQYIAWRYSPISNTINVTIRVAGYPSGVQGSPGIVIYSPNVGDQASDNNVNNFQGLLVSFNGNIYYHSATSGYTLLKSSAFSAPSTSFTVILTENSAGNVTVQSVYVDGTAYSVNVNTPFPWNQIGYVGIRGDSGNTFYVSYFAVNSIPLVSSSGVTSFNFYSPFSLSYTITNTSITVQNTQLVDGENYLIIPGNNGIIGASFAFYNVTNNVPVLAISSSPVSVTYNAPARAFTVVSPSQTFLLSPYGAPQQNYQTLTGGVIILPQSGKVTFYANYQPNLVLSSTVVSSSSTGSSSSIITTGVSSTTSSSTGSSLPPPTATTNINPNQATVVINGSVYLTAPWLVHYSIPSVNSSVTAYLVYNYSANKPVLVLSSPTNVNVDVTFTASNGTVLLSESVVSPTTVTLPVATGNVTVKTTNSTITIPITYQRFNVVSLTNAIMNSPIMGAVAVLLLFFVSFYIGFVFRTVPNAMALGAVVYITAVAPFLLAIGFPMSIVMLTVVLAVVALVYSVWALRVTNVER